MLYSCCLVSGQLRVEFSGENGLQFSYTEAVSQLQNKVGEERVSGGVERGFKKHTPCGHSRVPFSVRARLPPALGQPVRNRLQVKRHINVLTCFFFFFFFFFDELCVLSFTVLAWCVVLCVWCFLQYNRCVAVGFLISYRELIIASHSFSHDHTPADSMTTVGEGPAPPFPTGTPSGSRRNFTHSAQEVQAQFRL
jgi:hypothetical protein